MESHGCQSVCFKFNSQLPVAIQNETSCEVPIQADFKGLSYSSNSKHDSDNSRIKRPWYSGETTNSRPWILFKDVFSCGNAGNLGVSGLACKLPKVGDRAHTRAAIFRPGLEYPKLNVSSANPEGPRNKEDSVKVVREEQLLSKGTSNSLFDKSRRIALILLLASGRRLHDLTLLEVSKDKFIETENNITFWPRFGSKTDSGTYRQSGWFLTKHQDHRICPVTHVKDLVKASEVRRRMGKNLQCLFITVTGQVKPASRTVISGWLRSVIKQAKIDESPGSIRSAVASRGWLDNRPIQEILERGNWKCVETFKKFYCREVDRSFTSNSVCTDLYNNFKTLGGLMIQGACWR
ncbi:unnamed protein product, partial [Brenthis ino]